MRAASFDLSRICFTLHIAKLRADARNSRRKKKSLWTASENGLEQRGRNTSEQTDL